MLVETASRNSATKFVIGEKLLRRIGRGSSEGRGKGKEKGIELDGPVNMVGMTLDPSSVFQCVRFG